ncbi:MAG: hypothetical protein DWQ31_16775 [Planctomycetota bacterium]|nr:MAG: hypothetical protein DWQ31_16775 [Planctomycetota bacterium]REJ92008.1 MAG: hypothetical protein DWQ35_12725 [Planctomycetota bacterium]REK28544.1 MAG: hypothetical protein DWQ42_04315 [Planctomycetota bacterium]REK39159.1 MAG: hypothetical protein DWQ46_17900 [Planctomycetota bacterium]
MATATLEAAGDDLEVMLDDFGISDTFKPAFRKLAATGEIDNAEFRLRLNTCLNYQECLRAIESERDLPRGSLFTPENPPRWTPERN